MTSKQSPPKTDVSVQRQVVGLMWTTFGDTTWRLFIPSVGGTILGVWADNSWGTTPLMIIIGTGLGMACAIWLVVLQYRKVKGAK